MNCRCTEITELLGDEATEYAREHLVETGKDATGWYVTYVCPITGTHWEKDYQYGDRYGWARLRRVNDKGA